MTKIQRIAHVLLDLKEMIAKIVGGMSTHVGFMDLLHSRFLWELHIVSHAYLHYLSCHWFLKNPAHGI